MMNNILHYISICLLFCLASCQTETIKSAPQGLFTKVDFEESGIDFSNDLKFTEDYNPYTFKNFFSGGGVALGDINNDGLIDIYLSGSLVNNKLYLNKGNLKFEDITSDAGVACKDVWSTGISFVDINSDGYLDIYVCKSGKPDSPNRSNELFINNGDLTFKESASEYGLDFQGLATHAAFFDYDRDGDLDCYLLNNSIRSVGAYDTAEGLRDQYDIEGGNRLLRNDQEKGILKFSDVTQEAGIYGSAIGFGLGVSVGDLNNDHWPDLYVSNDFFEKDYVYLNNQNGTFKEVSDLAISEMSMGAMGADIADINNDAKPDIFVTEMLPETLERYKSKAVFDSYDKSKLNFKQGYHRQFGRNTLNVQTGMTNDGVPLFSEISRYSGVEATEWSWGALINDFDGDGMNDIFIANGIYKDLLDLDYINFFNPNAIRKMIDNKEDVITSMMDNIPSQKIANKLYINKKNYKFEDNSIDVAGGELNFSNGSAYGDLDNDGDLDLVINHLDQPASILENNSSENHYLSLDLSSTKSNLAAIGSKVYVYSREDVYYKEKHPFRGFQSTVDSRLHFSIPNQVVDSIKIIWPDGTGNVVSEISIDTVLQIRQEDLIKIKKIVVGNVESLLEKVDLGSIKHEESSFIDFDKERLRLYTSSNEGPDLLIHDFNNDKLEDIFIAGAADQSPLIYFQSNSGRFARSVTINDSKSIKGENTSVLLLNIDQDKYPELLITNGGNEVRAETLGLKDRLFRTNTNAFQEVPSSSFNAKNANTSCSCSLDIENDGDDDLIIGSYVENFSFGINSNATLYTNSLGKLKASPLEVFKNIGMITDCQTGDINSDGYDDIILATEFGVIHVFVNDKNGSFVDNTSLFGLDKHHGLWSNLELDDLDNDGDLDLLATNLGLNNRLVNFVKSKDSIVVFTNDFDQNRTVESITCVQQNGKYYPIHLKDDLVTQLPTLKKKFLRYNDYASVSLDKMFSPQILERSIIHYLTEFRTGVFENKNGHFEFTPLSYDVQLTWQKSSKIIDLNNDGLLDIILGGNHYGFKPELGIQAASYGHVLLNKGDMIFQSLSIEESGFFEKGEIRDIEVVEVKGEPCIIVAKNNDYLNFYRIR